MTRDFSTGNYRYIPAGFQFSSGVAADADFEIERVRFATLVPLADGFARVADYILGAGRPLTALCGCELRSPAAVDGAGFRAFNEHYVKTLAEWDIYHGADNPVARSNVCPEIDPPSEPSFHAFSFTRPKLGAKPSYVIAGSGESRSGSGSYPERLVRYRDLSPEGFQEKVRFVVDEMKQRLELLGLDLLGITATQVYTVHDFHALVADEFIRSGVAPAGMTWHFARPPVIDMEFEMDVRAVMREFLV